MTLREKIEGLHTAKTGWVKLADVLRIVAEHEQAQAPVLDITPGGPVKTAPKVGQAGSDFCGMCDHANARHRCPIHGQVEQMARDADGGAK